MTNNLSSDAAFQTFNSAIDTAILAMGWLHSSDTGQMNPATTNRAGVNTNAGYIIYKMDDALQATAPCFMKILFGQAGTATMYRLIIQLSTATDGAGTLTGNTTAAQTIASTGTSAALNCYFSGSTSRLNMALFPSQNNATTGLYIERDKDATGANTAFGWHVCIHGNGLAWFQQYVPALAYGPTSSSEAKVCTLMSSQTSQSNGTNVGLGVIRPVSGSMRNPGISVLFCSRGDFSTEVTNSVTIYSTARTYLALTAAGYVSTVAVANNASPGALILFE